MFGRTKRRKLCLAKVAKERVLLKCKFIENEKFRIIRNECPQSQT